MSRMRVHWRLCGRLLGVMVALAVLQVRTARCTLAHLRAHRPPRRARVFLSALPREQAGARSRCSRGPDDRLHMRCADPRAARAHACGAAAGYWCVCAVTRGRGAPGALATGSWPARQKRGAGCPHHVRCATCRPRRMPRRCCCPRFQTHVPARRRKLHPAVCFWLCIPAPLTPRPQTRPTPPANTRHMPICRYDAATRTSRSRKKRRAGT